MHTVQACPDPPFAWQQLTCLQATALAHPQVESEDKCHSPPGKWAIVLLVGWEVIFVKPYICINTVIFKTLSYLHSHFVVLNNPLRFI